MINGHTYCPIHQFVAVAGDCVKTRVPACKFDCMHDDGPTHSDDSAVITASLTKPEHLHSLTNGDVLFIDSATCVRRIRDRHVLTLFGAFPFNFGIVVLNDVECYGFSHTQS